MKTERTPVTLHLLPRQAMDILEEVDVTRAEQAALQGVILWSHDADTITRLICNPATGSRLSRLQIRQGAIRVFLFGDAHLALSLLATIPGGHVFKSSRAELLKKVLRRPIAWWTLEISVSTHFFEHLQPDEWEMMVDVVLRSRSKGCAQDLLHILWRDAVVPPEAWVRLVDLPVTQALKRFAGRE